ncbi:MAG: rhomboid family intramembrane serine protease [Gemmatimonadota bacterium]
MLILPYQTRFALRSAPFVTLALILVNTIVFFFAQARDERAYEHALDYYERSALPRIELHRYRHWLAGQTPSSSTLEQLDELQTALREQDIEYALSLMQGDDDFMRELHEFKIVTPSDPEFLTWRDQRNRFDSLQQGSTTERLLLQRGSTQPWRFVTYQFAHGDLGHWLGNMIVLLLAGSFAEPAMGRVRFLLGYLLSGAAAGALHLALSDAPVIGASGAIAGAMAMVAVLYGLRRVPVFVSVLFYFDTLRMPALLLLPIWIANELWQWATATEEAIAYAAHLGGFVFGAAFAWLFRPAAVKRVEPTLPGTEADAEHRARLRLQQRAEQAAAEIDIARATRLYAELAAQYPMRSDYAVASYNVALLGNDRNAVRNAAEQVLVNRAGRPSAELRRAYLHIAQSKTRDALPLDAQLRLARRLVRAREDAAALQLIDALLVDDKVRAERGRELSDCLLGLFTTYLRYGMSQQADEIRRRLAQYFAPPPSETSAESQSRTIAQGPSTLNFDLP